MADSLLAPNPTRDVLAWLNNPALTQSQWAGARWAIFTSRCAKDFGFNPETGVKNENRLERMAHAMGLSSGSDIPDAIKDMNARLGLPIGLKTMGVERDWYEKIIHGAMQDHCHKTNPRIATAQDYEQMLLAAM